MRREWEPEDLVAGWTLVEHDARELVAYKRDAPRLAFALMLKFFEIEARFPRHAGELPPAAIDYVARQVGVDPAALGEYEWSGSTVEYHRSQIRRALLTRPIRWEPIAEQYDQMVKFATALKLRTAEAEQILRRYARPGPQHPTYAALVELGRAVKSTFVARYLRSEGQRREINDGLQHLGARDQRQGARLTKSSK